MERRPARTSTLARGRPRRAGSSFQLEEVRTTVRRSRQATYSTKPRRPPGERSPHASFGSSARGVLGNCRPAPRPGSPPDGRLHRTSRRSRPARPRSRRSQVLPAAIGEERHDVPSSSSSASRRATWTHRAGWTHRRGSPRAERSSRTAVDEILVGDEQLSVQPARRGSRDVALVQRAEPQDLIAGHRLGRGHHDVGVDRARAAPAHQRPAGAEARPRGCRRG